jgi:hypothetical protein
MKKIAFIICLLSAFLSSDTAFAQVKKLPPVGILDMGFTLQFERGNQQSINNAWDYTIP